MGEGISGYILKCKANSKLMTKKCYEIIYRLISRTVTSPKFQGSEVLTDWMTAIGQLFSISEDSGVTNKR
jgi:hypothetical protein